MKLPALLVSDLHLTASVDDEYRWDLFRQLREEVRNHGVKTLVCLGDTTDAKDYHSSSLVNRIVDGFCSLRDLVDEVVILMGNHDYLKDGQPYLSFLNHIPGIKYVTTIHSDLDGDLPCLWLPHTRNPGASWADMHDLSWYEYVFMHQTVSGSIADNGFTMHGDGSDACFLHWKGDLPAIWSGDIHVPQTLRVSGGAKVNYVGSPYHVHFGDKFEPRSALLITKQGSHRDIELVFPKRHSIKMDSRSNLARISKQWDLHKGDQAVIGITLGLEDQHAWPRIRRQVERWAEEQEIIVRDLTLTVDKASGGVSSKGEGTVSRTPEQALLEYVEREGLGPDAYQSAAELL